MLNVLSICETFFESGFVFSLIAMGYYVSFTILDFPDLTVEGTFLSGAVVYALLITHGVNAYLAVILAFIAGFLMGTVTGFLHVRLHIRPLLCGILVSTALISINLVAVGAGMNGDFSGELSSQITLGRTAATLHNTLPAKWIPAKINGVGLRDFVIFLVFALAFKFLLDWFLTTKRGLLLRATGSNDRYVTTLARRNGDCKILGLGIGNGYAAVAGALYTQISGNVNQSMGIGTIVIGLASLIIGLSLFSRVRFLKPTTKIILGAILYQGALTLAQQLGMPSAYNKLIMAVLFTLALIFGAKRKRGGEKNA